MQHLEVLGGKIGSSDDGERLRDQVAEVTSSANTLSKETNSLMKRLVELSNDQVSAIVDFIIVKPRFLFRSQNFVICLNFLTFFVSYSIIFRGMHRQ